MDLPGLAPLLLLAAEQNHQEACRRLLDFGADPGGSPFAAQAAEGEGEEELTAGALAFPSWAVAGTTAKAAATAHPR